MGDEIMEEKDGEGEKVEEAAFGGGAAAAAAAAGVFVVLYLWGTVVSDFIGEISEHCESLSESPPPRRSSEGPRNSNFFP
jgi:hypothetical protein